MPVSITMVVMSSMTGVLSPALPLRAQVARAELDSIATESLAQIDGQLDINGLRDTVRVLRDTWGVPHIHAKNIDDLFFAQGFVHAQDRLWQMDMYRRTFEGRLAEVLGPEALRHDRLARRLLFRGPFDDREFTSYHPEGRRIFEAFADGVNAYIASIGDNLPVEFKLTGLRPLPWTAETSLLRTQTALPLGDARNELQLARNVAQFGVAEANRRANPSPYRDLVAPPGVDLAAIDEQVTDALGGLRSAYVRPPLLPAYDGSPDTRPGQNRGAQENSPGSNNWVVSGRLTASGKVIVANDPHRNASNPSIRYIVHLVAPGWNMIGATEAPLPGVAIGHNGRIAWGLTIVGTDQSDVYVEQLDPTNRSRVRWQDGWEPLRIAYDTILVMGRAPEIITLKYSRHGPIFFEDTARNLAYAMRSTMHEPGTAGYLGALRYHAVNNCREFLAAQVYWKAPTENMVCGDVDGNIAWQASALSPRRAGWDGRLPVSGAGGFEWSGFRDSLPRELNPERGWIATANHDIHPPGFGPPLFFKRGSQSARFERLADVLSNGSAFTLDDFKRLQHDAYSAEAARDVRLFHGWASQGAEVERARRLLAEWDATYRRESAAAALYNYVSDAMGAAARSDAASLERTAALEQALVHGLDSLRAHQGTDPARWRWGRIHRSELPHPLVNAFDIPAIERSGGAGTVAATGATFREIIDFANIDGSVATNLPGQSAQPGSPYYSNLVESYAEQQYFPLLYTRAALDPEVKHQLVLLPPERGR
ncbi:MAG: penicillin acylase family protein [Longimicrobiales bacterium]